VNRTTIVRFVTLRVALAAVACSVATASRLEAQRADTARAAGRVPRPPLSPRRAFLTSLVAPGYAQSVLGRPNAAAFFVLTEAIGVLMVREASAELRDARRLQNDSVALRFVNPTTGQPDTAYGAPRYSSALVRSRRAHLEDWIAALVANHVIAAADAFVAAHLWDVGVEVGYDPTVGEAARVAARFRW
jgi:hypothetical protein